jgi:hypothetical protein
LQPLRFLDMGGQLWSSCTDRPVASSDLIGAARFPS